MLLRNAIIGILLFVAATPALAQENATVYLKNSTDAGSTAVSASVPLPVTCESGCSGGGGGGNVNLTGINTVTPSVGNGTTDTGTMRVTVSSDSTGSVTVKQSTAANLKTQAQIVSNTTNSETSALSSNLVVHSGAAAMADFQVSADTTLSGAAWWLMFYDATSAPADGAVTPYKCYALPSGQTTFAGAFVAPLQFSTGITIGVSTTGCFTKTASTHAFISSDWQ